MHFAKVATDTACDDAVVDKILQCANIDADLDDREPYDADCFAFHKQA